MRRFDKHIPILSGLGDWARLRLILGGSNEYPPATVSSYTVVVSHLAFGTLSLRSINAPRWRRSWNVWISCSQDGPQGSQCLEHKYCRYGERLKERTKILKEINHKSGTQQAGFEAISAQWKLREFMAA